MVRFTWLSLLATCLATACYEVPPSPPTTQFSAPYSPSATNGELPTVSVAPSWLGEIAGLPANELFEAVGHELRVPPDLLRSLAITETALVPAHTWVLPDELRRQEAALVSGLNLELIQSNREAHLAAAAARLRALASEHWEAEEDVEDLSSWWEPVVAFSALPDRWLADRYAVEVFGHLQRGAVLSTTTAADLEQPDVVVIAPHAISSLTSLIPSEAPSYLVYDPEYPGALDGLLSPGIGPRQGPITRIELVATNRSWAHSTEELQASGAASYLLRRSDGAVTQLLHEGTVPAGGSDETLVIAMAVDSAGPGAWSPALLEGAARLIAYLSWRYDLPLNGPWLDADLGAFFPEQQWRAMVNCFNEGGGEACAQGLAAGPEGYIPPPQLDEEGARSEARAPTSIPYFYQYQNSLYPSASCQNTSVAMLLKAYGWNGTPDTITARFGKNLAQSPGGLAQVFNTVAAEEELTARLTPNTSGSLSGLQALLAAGKPTIVHGYFTSYGHVLVATGYDGFGYTANDPAGRWSQSFKGGYPYGWNPSAGRGVRYGKAAFEQAVATSNGSAYLPLWYHELTGVEGAPSSPEVDGGTPSDETGAEQEEGSTDASDGEGDGATEDSGGSSEGGDGGTESSTPYPWASVDFLEPADGSVVGDPLFMRAERTAGQRIEFWSGSYMLAESSANPGNALVDIWVYGDRPLQARNISEWGTLLATDSILVTVDPANAQPASCSLVGTLSCGARVTGNTATQGSSVLGGYPGIVGNYEGPEVGWTVSGGSGEVEFRFINPTPGLYNLDLILLETSAGTCAAADAVARGFNSLEVEIDGGGSYVLVVDGYAGDSGAFELEMDCSATES